ncbi:DUF3488 and DUF4129 domain-containing transglutaminase family protein [Streptomyces sp. NPDC050504]|uniref:DUF3488 and DUF4129 domain-containing transglutaminase family protein n=1 Tax=Streptomyces sp. NPDC050504 TaxID=3365618 RepID=UPI0037A577A3
MSGHGRLTLCAFAATLMAAGSMLPLVTPASWFLQAVFLVALQSGIGAAARRVPLARPLTVLVQALVSLLAVTLVFAREQAIAGIVPGPEALTRFADLMRAGGDDVARYAIPAPDSDGIKLMLVGGVLVIGLAVDALAVTFRSAAPAGLPLLALYSVAAGLSGGGASWLWFLLAASGYLLLLLAEGRDRLSQWGRVFGGARRPQGTAAGFEGGSGTALAPIRTGRRIGVVALGVALAVPAALPALDGGLLSGSGPGEGGGRGGGTISAVNPLVSLQDNLNQPENKEALRYRTNAPATQDLYLRILALDQFNGQEWKTSDRRVGDVPDRLPSPEGLNSDVPATQIETSISAAGWYGQSYLPMPYPATEVRAKGKWRYEPTGRTLVGDDGQKTNGAQYTVKSLLLRPTAKQLADAGPPPTAVKRTYTKVPDSLPAVVRETATRVTQGSANDYERAVKLQDWFSSSGGFTYDTSVSSGTGTEAIVRFLEDKEGFCVHFSFSMAAMARTLGIPARVAVGFTPGTSRTDGSMSVGLQDAHAWPELYFDGVGWTRFEPTPSRGSVPDYTRPETTTDGPTSPAEPSTEASAPASAGPTASDSCPAQLRRQGECGGPVEQGVAPPTDGGTPTSTVVGAGLAVLALLLVPLLPLLWRTRARARRLGSGGRTSADAASRTLAAWLEITDTAWDYGIGPDGSETPRRAAARIVRVGLLEGEAAEAVGRVAGAVEQVLYAPRPQPGTGLAADVRRVREGLAASAGRSAKLHALLAPRSSVRVAWAVSDRRAALAARLNAWVAGLVRRPSRQQ